MKGKNIRRDLKNFLYSAVLKHSMESIHIQIVKVDIDLLLQVKCNLHDFTFTLKIDFNTHFYRLKSPSKSQIVVVRTAVKHILDRNKSYISLLSKTF